MSRGQSIAKNVFDRVAALFALLATSPLFTLAALVIKTNSPGPIFFAQMRVGLNEVPFQIYKFRTMHVNADRHELGSVTVARDPRLFLGSRLLRKFKIDELPQLINVLLGQMSMVGPRPTVAEDYQRMNARQRRRALVKPGITGLAQIRCGAALPWPERIEFDLDYIDNYRLMRDLKILALTFWLVTTGRADLNPVAGDEWGINSSPTTCATKQAH